MNTAFAIYVLLHATFSPITEPPIKHRTEVIAEYTNPDACVKELNQRMNSGNYDPSSNSFGCVRIEHPSSPVRNTRPEGSGGNNGQRM